MINRVWSRRDSNLSPKPINCLNFRKMSSCRAQSRLKGIRARWVMNLRRNTISAPFSKRTSGCIAWPKPILTRTPRIHPAFLILRHSTCPQKSLRQPRLQKSISRLKLTYCQLGIPQTCSYCQLLLTLVPF